MKVDTKDQEALTRTPQKPPIYPVSVIEVACRALDILSNLQANDWPVEAWGPVINAGEQTAIRIICDGLASHEKAIKGEP